MVKSPILLEFWYKILIGDSSLSTKRSLYVGSYSCVIADRLALNVSVG